MRAFRATLRITPELTAEEITERGELTADDVRDWLVGRFVGCDLGSVEVGDVTAELTEAEVSAAVALITEPDQLSGEVATLPLVKQVCRNCRHWTQMSYWRDGACNGGRDGWKTTDPEDTCPRFEQRNIQPKLDKSGDTP